MGNIESLYCPNKWCPEEKESTRRVKTMCNELKETQRTYIAENNREEEKDSRNNGEFT